MSRRRGEHEGFVDGGPALCDPLPSYSPAPVKDFKAIAGLLYDQARNWITTSTPQVVKATVGCRHRRIADGIRVLENSINTEVGWDVV